MSIYANKASHQKLKFSSNRIPLKPKWVLSAATAVRNFTLQAEALWKIILIGRFRCESAAQQDGNGALFFSPAAVASSPFPSRDVQVFSTLLWGQLPSSCPSKGRFLAMEAVEKVPQLESSLWWSLSQRKFGLIAVPRLENLHAHGV